MRTKKKYSTVSKEGVVKNKRFNPQQLLALKLYLTPGSKTFGKIKKSLVAAGFGDAYASILNHRCQWFKEGISSRSSLLIKAENNLHELLDSEDVKVKADISKFVAERIGKAYYSQRKESSSDNRNVVVVLPPEIIQKNSLEKRIDLTGDDFKVLE